MTKQSKLLNLATWIAALLLLSSYLIFIYSINFTFANILSNITQFSYALLIISFILEEFINSHKIKILEDNQV